MMSGPHFEQLRTRLKGVGLGRVGMKKLKNFHKGKVMRKFSTRGGVMRKFRIRGDVMRISHNTWCYAKISHMHYSHAHLKF